MGEEFFDLSLKLAVVFDPPLAFPRQLFAERFGRTFALQESGPAIIDAVKFGRPAFAGAVGLAAGAGGGGDAAGQ